MIAISIDSIKFNPFNLNPILQKMVEDEELPDTIDFEELSVILNDSNRSLHDRIWGLYDYMIYTENNLLILINKEKNSLTSLSSTLNSFTIKNFIINFDNLSLPAIFINHQPLGYAHILSYFYCYYNIMLFS